jgi:hypothetical protein
MTLRRSSSLVQVWLHNGQIMNVFCRITGNAYNTFRSPILAYASYRNRVREPVLGTMSGAPQHFP